MARMVHIVAGEARALMTTWRRLCMRDIVVLVNYVKRIVEKGLTLV